MKGMRTADDIIVQFLKYKILQELPEGEEVYITDDGREWLKHLKNERLFLVGVEESFVIKVTTQDRRYTWQVDFNSITHPSIDVAMKLIGYDGE